ncbi:hypothetical protein Tco_1214360 [Tanacetum coccineum]
MGGAEIPQTCISSGVRSTEEMDCAINDLTSKFAKTLDEFNRGPRRGDRHRTIVGQNVNPRGYGKRQNYRVKAEIPNFIGNLNIKAVLDWFYKVDKFVDIMEVPKEEHVKVVAYKLRGGVGAWWQREQDNRRGQGKRTIADYTGEFLRLQAHCNLREIDKQSVARRSNMESSSNYGSRPNQIQSTIPSTTITTSSSKASGNRADKKKESQPVNSNPYARPTGVSSVVNSIDYPAIVYNDALTSNENVPSKPTIWLFHLEIRDNSTLGSRVFTDLMAEGLSGRMPMEHKDAQGQSVFTSRAWRQLFEVRVQLVHELILEFFSTFRFREAVLDLNTAGHYKEIKTAGFDAYWAEIARQIPDKGLMTSNNVYL